MSLPMVTTCSTSKAVVAHGLPLEEEDREEATKENNEALGGTRATSVGTGGLGPSSHAALAALVGGLDAASITSLIKGLWELSAIRVWAGPTMVGGNAREPMAPRDTLQVKTAAREATR